MSRPPFPPEGSQFTGPSKTLNDAHFLLFSGVTGDVHPSHYDVEYARKTRFGKPLAHGLLLASLTALGASEARERVDGFVLAEQGCRFVRPVVVGDTLQPHFVVERRWKEGHREFCRVGTSLRNQRGETVLEGFHVYRVLSGEDGKADRHG
ncbi:MaoC family dehydratase [Pigmentiphaga soli]|uniref:MaoC family dehydratase n=1 Tax=Pigmentiphaga soli TaxID=1007095 RepID=A0ABP8HIR0_9BURK